MTQQDIRGKLISLAGSPAAGKTFLANKLAEHFNADILYEHPESEEFPKLIKQSFNTQSHLFETIVWFRNRHINNHLRAKTLIAEGKNVITDVPIYHNQVFVGAYVPDPFLQNILYTMGDTDRRQYGYPDCTIYISTTTELVREFLTRRVGTRDWEKDKWFEFMASMPPFVEAYMNSIKSEIPSLIEVKRGEYDFALEKDFLSLVRKVERVLRQEEKRSS